MRQMLLIERLPWRTERTMYAGLEYASAETAAAPAAMKPAA